MRPLAVVFAIATLASCREPEPPPTLGRATPQLMALLRSTCGTELVDRDMWKGTARDRFLPSVKQRLASHTLIDAGCDLPTGEFALTYDAKTSELYEWQAAAATKAQAQTWLDALATSGLNADLAARARAALQQLPASGANDATSRIRDHGIQIIVHYGHIEPTLTVHRIEGVVLR